MSITRKGFIAIAVVGLGAAFLVGKVAVNTGLLGKPTDVKSSVPIATKTVQYRVPETVGTYQMPVTAHAGSMATCPTIEVLPWNGLGGFNLANGGINTTKGSMVDKYTNGGCLTIVRQDDYGQMEANLAKFVNSNGKEGDAFFAIMGDAYPYVAAALNKLVPGQFSAVGVVGISDGEDKCLVSIPGADKDPQKVRGALIAAVPRDGDWNICVKWASDNGIPINVDQKTYDPAAMNFVDVDAFTTADEKFITKACEDRTVIENGLAHGSKKVCVTGTATWTPGDVNVVSKYPGSVISIASTHDYAGQMPSLIIGVKSFMSAHRDYMVGLLKAADRGAMAIRSGNDGLMAMGQVQAEVLKEQDGAYWAKYFKGVVGHDHDGNPINLGGSKVITLQEARDYFGLRSGTVDTFASVYRTFKGYDETFYPTLYPKSGDGSIPAYEDVVDLSYLKDALRDIPESSGVIIASQAIAAPITQTVSKKAWHIEFDTGNANIKSESMNQLFAIYDSANIAQGLRLRIDGYTDNTGSAAINTPLSEKRAQAVADWLHNKAPANFPAGRMEVRGYGPANPLCSDNGVACRAQNRRVEITLGQ